MTPKPVIGFALLGLLLVVSVTIKLTGMLVSTEPDEDTLRTAIVAALARNGYTAHVGHTGNWWVKGLVTANKGTCTVYLRDATHYGPDLEAVTSRRMNQGRPIRYLRNGEYLSAYPRIRIEIEWRVQREFARLGRRYAINPVIAVGARDGCWPDAQLLRAIKLRYR